MDDVLVMVGGIIPDDDVAALREAGRGRDLRARHHDRAGRRLPAGERATARLAVVAEAEGRAAALSDAALGGDRLALARLLTAVENGSPVAEAALRRLYPVAGRAHLVGITGPPGSGKSTLVAALIAEVRSAGRTVAVIAVDPSSPITGGALLGDRVRMQAYADRTTASSSARWRRAGTPAASPRPRRRPRPCWTRPAST